MPSLIYKLPLHSTISRLIITKTGKRWRCAKGIGNQQGRSAGKTQDSVKIRALDHGRLDQPGQKKNSLPDSEGAGGMELQGVGVFLPIMHIKFSQILEGLFYPLFYPHHLEYEWRRWMTAVQLNSCRMSRASSTVNWRPIWDGDAIAASDRFSAKAAKCCHYSILPLYPQKRTNILAQFESNSARRFGQIWAPEYKNSDLAVARPKK